MSAAVHVYIDVTAPVRRGTVTIQITDSNTCRKCSWSATIPANATPAQKAAAIASAFNASACTVEGLFEATATGARVDILKQGGGGATATISADGTGEGGGLTTDESGGNGEHWFWRVIRWVVGAAPNGGVPPEGMEFFVMLTSGEWAYVVADGTMSSMEIEDAITAQLEEQGVHFEWTAAGLTSDFVPVGQEFPLGGVGVAWFSEGYFDYLSGIGTELLEVSEVDGAAATDCGISNE
ncbi:MAG: hypothetical protein HYV63_02000 [Candidatus Schekmanbacteria bacterium]|nr:hypothetical protein [Candidatus Schekmanbacteria bacterium]